MALDKEDWRLSKAFSIPCSIRVGVKIRQEWWRTGILETEDPIKVSSTHETCQGLQRIFPLVTKSVRFPSWSSGSDVWWWIYSLIWFQYRSETKLLFTEQLEAHRPIFTLDLSTQDHASKVHQRSCAWNISSLGNICGVGLWQAQHHGWVKSSAEEASPGVQRKMKYEKCLY